MSQSAAVMVLDEMPDQEDLDELVEAHLDTFDGTEDVEISIDILYKAPDWMDICEQDQVNAHMRDGGVCIVVLYVTLLEEGTLDDFDD
jgi:hypothetical protein